MGKKSANVFLTGSVVLAALAASDPVLAQGHTTGIAVAKSCPPSVSEGTVVTCTVTIENQDGLHGVNVVSATNRFPFPGGLVAPIVDCDADLDGDGSFVLDSNDGMPKEAAALTAVGRPWIDRAEIEGVPPPAPSRCGTVDVLSWADRCSTAR